MVNHLVFECGHRFPEFPFKLKKLKRALSIRRALSKKAKVPKDIAREGLCEVCADYSAQDFLAAGTHPENANKTFEELREERVRETIALAKEAAEKAAREAVKEEERRQPGRQPRRKKRRLPHPNTQHPHHHLQRKHVPGSGYVKLFDEEEDDGTEWLLAKDPEE
ncbi:uncharacterized protein EAF02_008160 [Botrytis sinoallii]|uniref:uncharacterized protein n=1 Tax=Botrytis sinoallii TaxID=1463999 RepID=UPI0018FF63E8|nr:uncharacterized protein EAF02_008160 [Botrytis sinoallii]KAF7876940.1 hypothetical protein EAF02_008160 [Botrytis sinoallii]